MWHSGASRHGKVSHFPCANNNERLVRAGVKLHGLLVAGKPHNAARSEPAYEPSSVVVYQAPQSLF
jgi:hypothetical protein